MNDKEFIEKILEIDSKYVDDFGNTDDTFGFVDDMIELIDDYKRGIIYKD